MKCCRLHVATLRIHSCLRKILDLLQSMMPICSIGKARKSLLFALFNNKGGGCYIKKTFNVHEYDTAVRSGIEEKPAGQQVKIDRQRKELTVLKSLKGTNCTMSRRTGSPFGERRTPSSPSKICMSVKSALPTPTMIMERGW